MIIKRVQTLVLGVCFVLISFTAVAQTPMPMMPPGQGMAPGADAAPTSATFDVLAVHATREGKTSPEIPSTLDSVSKILGSPPFDTYDMFDMVSQEEGEAPFAQETRIPINDRYSFHVTPSQNPSTGEIDIESRIAMLENGKTIDALWAKGKVAPGKPLVFRGLPMDDGELVVLVRLKQDDGDDSDSSESSEDQEEESEGEQQESDSEGQEGQEQDTPEDGEESDELKDLKNLEAILQSLEDLDRREQEEARNQRERIRLKGDWW